VISWYIQDGRGRVLGHPPVSELPPRPASVVASTMVPNIGDVAWGSINPRMPGQGDDGVEGTRKFYI